MDDGTPTDQTPVERPQIPNVDVGPIVSGPRVRPTGVGPPDDIELKVLALTFFVVGQRLTFLVGLLVPEETRVTQGLLLCQRETLL